MNELTKDGRVKTEDKTEGWNVTQKMKATRRVKITWYKYVSWA
jgi:hypothetical protein